MDRRQFLVLMGATLSATTARRRARAASEDDSRSPSSVRLFLCGDVMTGRGIDQVLAHPSPPQLFEPWVRHAGRYVTLAEERNGPIPRPVEPAYLWGDALVELERQRPDLRIVNLETAITRSQDHWPGKGIHYRMHPANLEALTVAGIDCCVLANNHVLDWGYPGLAETLTTLRGAGIQTVGAGSTAAEAAAPAVLEIPGKGRVLVFAFGSPSSGIPRDWAATERRPGVHLIDENSEADVGRLAAGLTRRRRPNDLVVASVHWGANWGYGIPHQQRQLARRLIEECGVDVVHGHSSHHAKGIEVIGERPVLYGCGDFLNDYEGIGGHESFRGDLGLAYFLTAEPSTGKLQSLAMTAFRSRRFRLESAASGEVDWLQARLDREGSALGTEVTGGEDGVLHLRPVSGP